MALDVPRLRKLVALDEDDPLSRFALGQALFRPHKTIAIKRRYVRYPDDAGK